MYCYGCEAGLIGGALLLWTHNAYLIKRHQLQEIPLRGNPIGKRNDAQAVCVTSHGYDHVSSRRGKTSSSKAPKKERCLKNYTIRKLLLTDHLTFQMAYVREGRGVRRLPKTDRGEREERKIGNKI